MRREDEYHEVSILNRIEELEQQKAYWRHRMKTAQYSDKLLSMDEYAYQIYLCEQDINELKKQL